VSPIFSLEEKRCEKVAKLGKAKKRVCFASFRIIAKTDSQAKKLSEKKRKEAKRSETKRNEAKRRLYVSNKGKIIIF
jgi:hypothetical protein